MKRKQSLYRPAAIGMSLLMTAGLTACQGALLPQTQKLTNPALNIRLQKKMKPRKW